jgi:uncharacterized membrane protein YbjE (DUF340 family)
MRIGLLSVSFAISTVLGTVVLLFGLLLVAGKISTIGTTNRKKQKEGADPSNEDHTAAEVGLAEPLRLFLLVVAGFLCGYFLPIFGWFQDKYTTYLLYALLFLIGVQMVRNEVDLKRAMLHPATFFVPLLTMIGSLGGGFVLAGLFELEPGKALSLAAGFGWYSLSGVLITEMGDPILGAAGFMINVIRESIALLAIPFFARLNMPMIAIGVGGATSMDVTLPLIERSCGTSYVPLSIVNGAVLSMLVPILVPFFFSLG